MPAMISSSYFSCSTPTHLLLSFIPISLQNQSSAVGGFLPLLMGGGLFSARMPPAATQAPPLLADPVASLLSVSVDSTLLISFHNGHCYLEIQKPFTLFVLRQQLSPHSVPRPHEAPPNQNGAFSDASSSPVLHSPLNGKDGGNQM